MGTRYTLPVFTAREHGPSTRLSFLDTREHQPSRRAAIAKVQNDTRVYSRAAFGAREHGP